MTADEFELLSVDEAEELLTDRYVRLVAAGYTPSNALVAATHVGVDVEVAEQLVRDTRAVQVSVCTLF